MLSGGIVDFRTRVWMSFSMQEVFRLLGTRDQCGHMSSLSMQLSHAAGLYGVRGLGPNR